jgi:hypothetical protein
MGGAGAVLTAGTGRRLRKLTESRRRRNMARYRLKRIRRGECSGPEFLLEIVEELDRRLSSRGGPPTDFEWDVRRRIPLRRTHWNVLTRLGAESGVNPAHLIAVLIEKGVERLASEPRFGPYRPGRSESAKRPARGHPHPFQAVRPSSEPPGVSEARNSVSVPRERP